MGLLDINKAKLLSEIKTAIDNGEDFIVTKSGDRTLFVVGKYDIMTGEWINPRIDARLKIVDE